MSTPTLAKRSTVFGARVAAAHWERAVDLLKRAVPSRHYNVDYLNAMLTAAEDTLTLYATDTGVELTITTPATDGKAGTLAVPVNFLLPTLGCGDVTLGLERQTFTLNASGRRFRHQTAGSPTPIGTSDDSLARFTVQAGELEAALTWVRACVDQKDERPGLGSVFFDASDRLVLAGADGSRGATVGIPLEGLEGRSPEAQLLVPYRATGLLRELASLSSGEILLTFYARRLTATLAVGELGVVATMLSSFGQFPAELVTKMTSAPMDAWVSVERRTLAEELKRVMAASRSTDVWLTAYEGNVELASPGDLDAGVKVQLPELAEVEGEYTVCVNGELAAEITRASNESVFWLGFGPKQSYLGLCDGTPSASASARACLMAVQHRQPPRHEG